MRFHSYQRDGFYDEMFEADGVPRPQARLLLETIESPRAGPASPLSGGGGAAPARTRNHFQRVRRFGGHGADFPLRPDPPHPRGRGMGLDRARAHSEDPRSQPLHRRHLPRPEDPARPDHSERGDPLGRLLPSAVRGSRAAARRVVPHHRHGLGARPRRPDVRARGQPARALGRLLRAGEPGHPEAHVPAGLRRAARASGGRLSQPAARNAGIDRPGGRGDQAGGGTADAGHLQFRLLRTQLPGPEDGRAIGGKAATSWCRTAPSGCAPPKGAAGWT